MRLIFGILLACVALIALASAYPAELENVDETNLIEETDLPPAQNVEEEVIRHKRATCDHSVCVRFCHTFHKRGSCTESGACVCWSPHIINI